MFYTSELFKVCGIAILCCVCLLTFGKLSGALSVSLRIGGAVVIFGVFVYMLSSNMDLLESTFEGLPLYKNYFSEAFSLMLKALGIALISRLCADICRDCGEATFANGVESVGKVAIFSLSIPVISNILSYALQILNKGG